MLEMLIYLGLINHALSHVRLYSHFSVSLRFRVVKRTKKAVFFGHSDDVVVHLASEVNRPVLPDCFN